MGSGEQLRAQTGESAEAAIRLHSVRHGHVQIQVLTSQGATPEPLV